MSSQNMAGVPVSFSSCCPPTCVPTARWSNSCMRSCREAPSSQPVFGTKLWVVARQVDDKSNLEYQAGQPEGDEGGQEPEAQQPRDKPQKQEQDERGGQNETGEEGEAEDEGGVNEDAADQHEDRQSAQPQVSRPLTTTCP